MNKRFTSGLLALAAVLFIMATGWHDLAAGKGEEPLVTLVADDVHTRGDWLGAYGRYAYVLCGMRSPSDLRGASGWPVPKIAPILGDPEEKVRAWRSSAPTENDLSVLMEPNGLKRTAASWDDCGETRPLGEGPDLHLQISVPSGSFLLSLYFFEIDWIQYRSYRIRVLDRNDPDVPLIETEVNNFFKGKYKRFAVNGPAELLIIIERGQSSNAELSGIFLDQLAFPDMRLLDLVAPYAVPDRKRPDKNSFKDTGSVQRQTERVVSELLKTQPIENAGEYIRLERRFFEGMAAIARNNPAAYYGEFEEVWRTAAERFRKASSLLTEDSVALERQLLKYYAAHACCDYEQARRQIREIARVLLQQGLTSREEPPAELRLLHDFAAHLMELGQRAEARVALEAYVELCLKREESETAREKLVDIGKLALRANVSLPVAEGLSKWQQQYGGLSMDERLLLGNLFYVAARNRRALAAFESAEPQLESGLRHRWLLVAMMTCLLRDEQPDDAEALFNRLKKIYPLCAEIDEAQYRFGTYHYDKRDLRAARDCFEKLRKSSLSESYKDMAMEYLGRIEHLEQVRKLQAKNK